MIGQLGQLFGAKVGALGGQVGFDGRAGHRVHPAGQVVEEPADHRHLPEPELPLTLGGGGGRQDRRQRFTGQPVPRP